MNWIHKQLLKLKFYHLFVEWTKVAVFPGFSPLPIYTVATFFFQEIAKDSLVNKASSLSYNFMLAIFPAIIFLFTLIAFIPYDGFQDKLMSLIALTLPTEAFLTFESTLEDIIKNQNGKLLSFGFIFAMIFATNGVHNLMQAFNKSSLIIETRTWLKQRMVALNLTFLIVLALLVGIAIITASEIFFNIVKNEIQFRDSFWVYLVAIVRWVTLISIYFVTTSILYRYGPANPKKWRFFSAGSWMATILAILTFWGFSFYINNFGTYNKVYGSIGTLIVVMLWLYLNSLILLIGFELNASIDLSKKSIKIIKPRFNTFKKQPAEDRLETSAQAEKR